MNYEVLVINKLIEGRTALMGNVVAIKASGHVWGRREKEDRFAIIPFIGTPSQLEGLLSGDYRYDKALSKFRHTQKGFDFDGRIYQDASSLVVDWAKQVELANQIDPNWETTNPIVCDYLTPEGWDGSKGYIDLRHYLWEGFITYKDNLGVRDVLNTIRHGNFYNFGRSIGDLTPNMRQTIMQVGYFKQSDIDWFKKLGRVT